MSSPGSCYADRPSPPYLDCPVIPKLKMSKDPVPMSKYKPRGVIKYYPFESFDELSRREVMRFRVTPFGRIQESCAHIPYNSGKKDFFEKTGRESFEVFKYEFKVPGEDNEFTVMWDYNVGLVRMTPFFKCCKYSKMLSLNPGLKDITHSITGGAIAAQGYWMPYECAKAVCATFCYNIAGALIPIFGPSFPSMCIPPGSPDYGRMVIDHRIVEDAIREADLSRKPYRLVDESYRSPHPYLSAVPRFTPLNRHTTAPRPLWHKRPIDHDESDGGRDSGESTHGSSPALSYVSEQRREDESDAEIAEQNAALGLMTLRTAPRKEPGYLSDVDGQDTHRSKRRRATSA
uniref:Apses transcription factor xbp1 n=1 Tax=Colletotrichum fructicola (strain Nara gc5) TaxID=1213859 RepID=L2FDI5_COLFN